MCALCYCDASHVAAGCVRLIEHLGRRKVLVVIDDIGNGTQLNNLLPRCALHPGSRVIVTSRNQSIFRARCIRFCAVELLPMGRDVELFEAWAFAEGRSACVTSTLVSDVVARCGRLPLTLKVGLALSHFVV